MVVHEIAIQLEATDIDVQVENTIKRVSDNPPPKAEQLINIYIREG